MEIFQTWKYHSELRHFPWEVAAQSSKGLVTAAEQYS